MKDPEKIIKDHYYAAKRRFQRLCNIRDSTTNKAKKAIWNTAAMEVWEVKTELFGLYLEIYEKEL